MAKAVGGKVGEVKSIRIARSGFVVVECVSEKQMFGMFSIKKVNGHIVECFEFGGNKVGVISGVPLTTDLETFEDIHCVKRARRIKRFGEGKMEPSQSVCLTFYGDLPERIYAEYVTYRVRPYERGPLRCFAVRNTGMRLLSVEE